MKMEDFDLRQDPFPIVPDGPVHNWAGREGLKEDLVDLISGVRARDIGVTEFGIIYGEYGSGKSHALRYLKTLIDEDVEEFSSLAFYVERPRVATKLNFLELYKYIIISLGRERLKQICLRVRAIVDERVGELARIAEKAGVGPVGDSSSFVDVAIENLRAQDRPMTRLLMRGAGEGSKVFEFLAGMEKCDGAEFDG